MESTLIRFAYVNYVFVVLLRDNDGYTVGQSNTVTPVNPAAAARAAELEEDGEDDNWFAYTEFLRSVGISELRCDGDVLGAERFNAINDAHTAFNNYVLDMSNME